MIPIQDTIQSHSTPIITWMIIIVNPIVFLNEVRPPANDLVNFIDQFGLTPARLNLSSPSTWTPLTTHMFFHGGWLHLIGNMWFLFIFGNNVENWIGRSKFLLFYLIGEVKAGIIQSNFETTDIPSACASGAITAVLDTNILFFPTTRIVSLIPIIIIPWFVLNPALVYIGLWFFIQLGYGLISKANSEGISIGNMVWWADRWFFSGSLDGNPNSFFNQKKLQTLYVR